MKNKIGGKMKVNNNSLNDIPVWVIILIFVFFWPIGLVLLILKFTNNNIEPIEKLKSRKISNIIITSIMFVIGIIFSLVALVGVSEILNGSTGTDTIGALVFLVILIAIFVILGVWRCKKAIEISNMIRKIYKYQNLIIDREIYDLDEIASNMNILKTEILNDVAKYIRDGYLSGIRVKQNIIEKIPEYISPDRIHNIICSSCGANNKCIQGKVNKCGYCGTILNVDIK